MQLHANFGEGADRFLDKLPDNRKSELFEKNHNKIILCQH